MERSALAPDGLPVGGYGKRVTPMASHTTEPRIDQIRRHLGQLMHLRSYTDLSPYEQARWNALIEAEDAYLASR